MSEPVPEGTTSRRPDKSPFFLMMGSLSAGVAGMFVLSIPIWAYGIPGVDGDTPYIRGWALGSNAATGYFVVWLGTLIATALAKRSALSKRAFEVIAWLRLANLVVLFALLFIAARLIRS